MLLMLSSFVLSASIIGLAVYQARILFGALRETARQTQQLAGLLDTCVEGNSFREVLSGWSQSQDAATRRIAKNLQRLFEKEPLQLHGRMGWVIDLEGLCDGKRAFKQHEAAARAEAMPGMLTGIGILMTFLGLAVGIYGLDPTNADQMTAGVKQLLGGMSVAFLTSIAGIGGALWWTWMLKDVSARFESAFDTLSDCLQAKSFLLIPDEMNYQFLQYQAMTAESLSNLEETTTRAVAKAFDQLGLRQILEQMGERENEKRMVVIMGAMRNEIANMATAFTQTADLQKKMTDSIQKLLIEQGPSGGGDPAQNAKLVAHTRRMLTDFGNVHQNQTDTLEAIKGTAEEVKNLMKTARVATGDIIKNHQMMSAHIQRLEQHWDTYRAYLQQMQQTLEKTLSAFKGEMEVSLTKIHEDFDALTAKGMTHFAAALKEFGETVDALSVVVERGDTEPTRRKLFGKRS